MRFCMIEKAAMLGWDALKMLGAIARHGNLTRAAKALDLTQPTAGRRLAALESAVGAPLFERTAAGLVPTALGEQLAQHALQMEQAALAAERAIAGRCERLQGVVTVTSLDWFAGAVLAPLLAAFSAEHPGVMVRLMADARTYSLSRREADLAFRSVPFQQLDLAQQRVGCVKSAVYAAPAYLERAGMPDFDAGLAGHAVLTLHEGAAHVPAFNWLAAHGQRARIALRSNSVEALLAAARAGAGLTVLPILVGDAAAGLVRVPTPQAVPSRDIWMGVHEDLRRVPRIRALMDHLVAGMAAQPVLQP
jgi:DNA-binding transcriptional LysR family regulator